VEKASCSWLYQGLLGKRPTQLGRSFKPWPHLWGAKEEANLLLLAEVASLQSISRICWARPLRWWLGWQVRW
jgi:hypothetical protein